MENRKMLAILAIFLVLTLLVFAFIFMNFNHDSSKSSSGNNHIGNQATSNQVSAEDNNLIDSQTLPEEDDIGLGEVI